MRKVLVLLTAVMFVFGLTLSGCGGGSSDPNGDNGSITVNGLPSGYRISNGEINTNPGWEWVSEKGGIKDPGDYFDSNDKWFPGVIGKGYEGTGNNNIRVYPYEYRFDSQGLFWRQKYIDNNSTFSFSGTASVIIYWNGSNKSGNLAFNNVTFSKGHATVDYSSAVQPEEEIPEIDIDENLIGTWNEKNTGSSLFTMTFSTNGITWGGSSGATIQNATQSLINQGYKIGWIAKDGAITYVYGTPQQSVKVYDYEINGDGELELKTSGLVIMTLVKQ